MLIRWQKGKETVPPDPHQTVANTIKADLFKHPEHYAKCWTRVSKSWCADLHTLARGGDTLELRLRGNPGLGETRGAGAHSPVHKTADGPVY